MLVLAIGGALLVIGGVLVVLRELRRRRALSVDVMLGDEAPIGDGSELFWNTRCSVPGEHDDSAVVRVGTVYTLESIIERRRGARGRSLDPRRVLGRHVTFELIGDGIELRAKGREEAFRHDLLSPPLLCEEGGTPAFAAEWRALRQGRVFITAVLAVDGLRLDDITLWFETGEEAATLGAPLELEVPIDAGELFAIEGRDLVLHAIRRDLLLELTLEQPSVPGATPQRVAADADASALNGLVLELRKELERLSRSYPLKTVDDIKLRDATALESVAVQGRLLYDAIFGAIGEGHTALDVMNETLRGAPTGSRLEVDDGGAAVPWGILYDGSLDIVDAERFWGTRFRISRRVITIDTPTVDSGRKCDDDSEASPRPVVHSFVNMHVLGDVVTHQVEMETGLEDVMWIGLRGRSNAELRSWMMPGAPWRRCDLLYVFGHATVIGTTSNNGVPNGRWPDGSAMLDLDSEDDAAGTIGLKVSEMTVLRRQQGRLCPLPDKPVAFINACSSGRADAQCMLNPFVKLFVKRWGMPVFIGTDWATPQRFAAPFARAVLTQMAQPGTSIGDALWSATRETVVTAENPFALNYCLYGRPDHILVPSSAVPA